MVCINTVDTESTASLPVWLSSVRVTAMVLECILLAALVSIAIANPLYHHHFHGYHNNGHDDYHHGQHGYHAGHHGHHGYHGGHHGLGHHDYHHDNIDYKFNYNVKDDKTYNYQSRDEYKDGKNVYGSYSLVEPDGKTRIVKYKADDYGFHADVDYKGGYKQEYKPSYAHHDHHY